ncbi:MAG: DUF6340 family protein [Bacteroidales bacterium]|jgi:hypothetical protein
MKWRTRISVLALPVFLSGCYAGSLLEMDGLQPAEITIPSVIRSLTVVSRSDLDSVYKVSLQAAGKMPDFKWDSVMSKQLVLGCSDALVESPRFDLYNPVVKRCLLGDAFEHHSKIPWDVVRMVSGDPPKDAVLSMEQGMISDSVVCSTSDGWPMACQCRVVVKSFWRLYRLNDFQSKEFRFADTVTFDINSPSQFSSSSDQRIGFFKDAMYIAGQNTAKKLAPWWTNFERYYFTTASMNFNNGARFLRESKWREAAEVFRPYTESDNKTMAAKACYNMSLTCEMANNISAAMDWLKQSKALGMHDYFIDDYQAKLIKRKAEIEKLDEQMK